MLSHRATVAVNDLTRDVRRVVTDEESCQMRDVLGLSPTLKRCFVEDSPVPRLAGGLAPRSLDPAGCNAIDSNLGSETHRQRTAEPHDGILGRREQFAAVTGHTTLCLIPTNGDD